MFLKGRKFGANIDRNALCPIQEHNTPLPLDGNSSA